MRQEQPVTGSWTSVVSLLQGIIAAGFARVEERVREGRRESLSLVFGDDEAIRRLYEGVAPERERLRSLGAYRAADEVLCGTQRRAHTLGERSLSLATNGYGWAVHDIMGSNIAGGRASQTARGATLEECVRYAASACARAGTTLSIHPSILVAYGACSWAQAADLARSCGATDEQQAWILATPEREEQARREATERAAKAATRRAFAGRVERLFRDCSGIARTSSWAGHDEATVVVDLRSGLVASVRVREDGAVASLLRVERARSASQCIATQASEGHPTLRGVQALLLGMVRQGLSQAEVAS